MLEIALISLISVSSIGPTHMLAIREGLKNGFRPFFFILIGGVLVDILYADLALWVHSIFNEFSILKLIMLPIGMVLFFFLGYLQIKALYSKNSLETEQKIIISPMITGVFMTLPNPFALIMWMTLFSSSKIINSYFLLSLIILGVGILFIFSEGIIISILKKRINAHFLKYVEIFTAILLLYFAYKFGYDLVATIMQF